MLLSAPSPSVCKSWKCSVDNMGCNRAAVSRAADKWTRTLVSAWLGRDTFVHTSFKTAGKSMATNSKLAFRVAAFQELVMQHSLFLWPTPACWWWKGTIRWCSCSRTSLISVVLHSSQWTNHPCTDTSCCPHACFALVQCSIPLGWSLGRSHSLWKHK